MAQETPWSTFISQPASLKHIHAGSPPPPPGHDLPTQELSGSTPSLSPSSSSSTSSQTTDHPLEPPTPAAPDTEDDKALHADIAEMRHVGLGLRLPSTASSSTLVESSSSLASLTPSFAPIPSSSPLSLALPQSAAPPPIPSPSFSDHSLEDPMSLKADVPRRDRLAGKFTSFVGKVTHNPSLVLEGRIRANGGDVAWRSELRSPIE